MASKAAVIRFTEALAGECFDVGVRVFPMSPGMLKTDMTAEVFADRWDEEGAWTPMNAISGPPSTTGDPSPPEPMRCSHSTPTPCD